MCLTFKIVFWPLWKKNVCCPVDRFASLCPITELFKKILTLNIVKGTTVTGRKHSARGYNLYFKLFLSVLIINSKKS